MADETEGWVQMRHPDLPVESTAPDGGYPLVHPEAFEQAWAPLGWVLVDEAATPPSPAKAPRSTTPPTPQES